MRVTKQGIRDLNDKPKNERQYSGNNSCFHQWQHYKYCDNCRDYTLDSNDNHPCLRQCQKCGEIE